MADIENKPGILQERDAVEDVIKHMIAMHISPQSLHGLAKSITNPEERDLLALAAIRSQEWRNLMATYQTPHPNFRGFRPLFSKLLMSSGAYDH